ncbi:MAG: hypothetical protein WDN31_13620 [Hyphomicrobium sp.]
MTLRYEDAVRSRLGPIIDSAMRRVLGAASFQDVVRDKARDLLKRIAAQVNRRATTSDCRSSTCASSAPTFPSRTPRACSTACAPSASGRAGRVPRQGTAEANRIRATGDREATVILAEATRKGEELRGACDADRNKIYAEAYSKDPEFFEFYPLDAGL